MSLWPEPTGWLLVALGALGLGLFIAGLPWLIRDLVWLVLWPRYSLRVVGREHVPGTGPVLVLLNHVSWLDGFVIAAGSPRKGKALTNAQYIAVPVLSFLARYAGIIPIPSRGPRAQRAAIEAVRAAFDRGELVAIFPEAQISRNGLLGPFYRGLEIMLKGRDDVTVIPAYLDNLWGSIFSFSGGRFFRKRPRGWRRRVILAFGPPVPPPWTAFAVRQGVQETGVRARAALGRDPGLPETVDLALPHWRHPEFGLLAVSTADYHRGDIHQIGQKPGTVGKAPPGVALRAIGDDDAPLPPDAVGRLQARLPGRAGWVELGRRGALDRDGFLSLAPEDGSG